MNKIGSTWINFFMWGSNPTRWTVATSWLHCRGNIHENSVDTLSTVRRSVVGCDLLGGPRILRFSNRGRRYQPGVMGM